MKFSNAPNKAVHRKKQSTLLPMISDVTWSLKIYSLRRSYIPRSGSVVEYLTRDRGIAGSRLTRDTVLCPWTSQLMRCLVLAHPNKTCPYKTENCWLGHKELKQNSTSVILTSFSIRSETFLYCSRSERLMVSLMSVTPRIKTKQHICHTHVSFRTFWNISILF